MIHRIFAAALALWMVALMPQAARAHASLVSVNPANGVLTEQPPPQIDLTFSELVGPLRIALIAPDGTTREETKDVVGGLALSVPLNGIDQRGTYVLTWRVASEDGHPVAGSYLFSVGEITGAAPVVQSDPVLRVVLLAVRVVAMASLFIGVGGALFVAFVGLPEAAVWPRRLIWMGLVAVPLTLGLHGTDALGLSLGGVFDPAAWQTSWSTSFGPSALLALVSVILAGLSLRYRGRAALVLAGLATVVCAFAFATTGHASAADPQILTRPMVFVHATVLLFWIGALLPLFHALGTADRTALPRFSDVIPFGVGLLILSRVTLSFIQLGANSADWPGRYGYILLAKLSLLAVLFALAAHNRWFLTAPAIAQETRASQRLQSVVRVEVGLILLILMLVAGWRFAVPPRAVVHLAGAPVMLHMQVPKAMAMMDVSSDVAGPVKLGVMLSGAEMAPVEAQTVTLRLSNITAGIEATSTEMRRVGVGHWVAEDVVIPMSGAWTARLEVRLGTFDMVTLEGQLQVR